MKKILILFFIIVSICFAKDKNDYLKRYINIENLKLNTDIKLIAKDDLTPLWLFSCKDGIINKYQDVLILNNNIDYKIINSKRYQLGLNIDALIKIEDDKEFDLLIPEYNIYLKNNFVDIYLGAYQLYRGINNSDLSSGSLLHSRNSRAWPRISIGKAEFVSLSKYLPIKKYINIYPENLIEVKWFLSHGWLGEDRYVANAYMHEKDGYIKLNFKNMNFIYGIGHSAIWGGKSKEGLNYSHGFDDFIRVFFAKSGGDDSVEFEKNVLGNHLGIHDFGYNIKFEKIEMKTYFQHFFEDRSGKNYKNLPDGLTGINLKFANKNVSSFLYEYLHTTYQGGEEDPEIGGGRENYYSNGLYKDGWSYKDMTIGTPLFIFDGSGEYNNFIHSRLKVHHIGLKGNIKNDIEYKILSTFVKYYGNYNQMGSDIYLNGLYQNYFLLEFTKNNFIKKDNYSLILSLAYDDGEIIKNNFAAMISLKIDEAW